MGPLPKSEKEIPLEEVPVKVIASCLTMLLLFTSSGMTQSTAGQNQSASPGKTQHTTKFRATVQKLGIGGHVRVTLRKPSSEIKGVISGIRDDGFDVTSTKTGEVVAVPYSNVQSLHGPGMSTGKQIGISVAFLVVVAAAVVAVAVALALHH